MFDLRALSSETAADARPRGLLVTMRSFEGGMASASALREVFLGLRKAGRRVVVYLPSGVDTKGYFVASAADAIYAFPGASVALLGFASRGVYLKDALVKAGVVAEVLAHGKYKSAGDSLSRSSRSEPEREQVEALLDGMYGALTSAIVEGRGLTESAAKVVIDEAVYRVPEAILAKLLDASLFDDQVMAALSKGDGKEEKNYGAPAKFTQAPAYLRARRATKLGKQRGRPFIGIVRVHGGISQGGSGAFSSGAGAVEREVVAAVREARENPKVRGVLLHIDSPGGSALASARMHRELELLATEKPLVAVMANVAASGGYYVAAAAHAIVAEPVTITGSIGVIAARFAIGPILDRLGVHVDVIKRGARANLFDPVRPLEPADKAAIEREIASTYNEFVEVVARGRKMTFDEVHALAQGRVWTGADAKARGLVDVLGGFEAAMTEVTKRVGAGSDGLFAREVRGHAKDLPTLSADPSDPKGVVAGLVRDALGEWADLVPLLTSDERVLLWAPDAMGRRGR